MSKITSEPKSLKMGPGPGLRFFHSQMHKASLPPAGTSLAGQTVILTGGNVGLGFSCAEWLVDLDLSHLILAVRTPSKGEAVAKELRKRRSSIKIDVWPLDMLSYKSIQDFATRCQSLDRLDIAILNAGMTDENFKMGQEGHEVQLQTNYLSTVLLSHLLLPILKSRSPAAKPGRLTIVNSGTSYHAKLPHRNATPWLPTFDTESNFDGVEQYSGSKALAHLWIRKLAERVRSDNVVVNLVDPGLCKGTSLHRDVTGIIGFIFAWVKSLFGRTMRNGSSTYIDAAVVKGADSHGSFVMDWEIQPYITMAHGAEGQKLADKLWEETVAELSFANIEQLLDM